MQIKLYCGGKFHFDYLIEKYELKAKDDYRSNILGDYKLLLEKHQFVSLSENIDYIGPFYFESDGMIDIDIVKFEKTMIENCTHAIFLLEDGLCPGTISELIYATLLNKNVNIFYIKYNNDKETESTLRSPCWYPMLLSKELNNAVNIVDCKSIDDAKMKIRNFVEELKWN